MLHMVYIEQFIFQHMAMYTALKRQVYSHFQGPMLGLESIEQRQLLEETVKELEGVSLETLAAQYMPPMHAIRARESIEQWMTSNNYTIPSLAELQARRNFVLSSTPTRAYLFFFFLFSPQSSY